MADGLCPRCGVKFFRHRNKQFCTRSCQRLQWRADNPDWHKKSYARHKARSNAASRKRYYKTRQRAPWEILVTTAKVRAKQACLPFDLTHEWGADRWTGRCEMSNLPFLFGPKQRRTPFSPSIDKIVPTLGYTRTNCRFILWGINSLKGVGTDEDVFNIAVAIIDSVPPISTNPATDSC